MFFNKPGRFTNLDEQNLRVAIERLCSHRQPMWDSLPFNHTPRLYKFELQDRPSGNTESHLTLINFRERDDRLLRSSLSDQLRIRKHLRGFNPFKPRYPYITLENRSGKSHPHMTYKQHAEMAERIVNSRLAYFRKKNLYYSGWSMQDWWDEKLRAEEKSMKENKQSEEDKKVTIGRSMQERLYEAAHRELSYESYKPDWSSKTPRRILSCPANIMPISTVNEINTNIIGHLNWTPIKRTRKIPAKKWKKEPEEELRDTYLPIIFHWKEMEPSRGYELNRIDKQIKCGYYQG